MVFCIKKEHVGDKSNLIAYMLCSMSVFDILNFFTPQQSHLQQVRSSSL